MDDSNEYTTEELIMEANWEHEAISAGFDKYIEDFNGKAIEDTDEFRSVILRIFPRVADRLRALQDEYVEFHTTSGSGVRKPKARRLAYVLPLLNVDTLAVTLCRLVLLATLRQDSVPLSTVLNIVLQAVRDALALQALEHSSDDLVKGFLIKFKNNEAFARDRSKKSRLKKHMNDALAAILEDRNEDVQLDMLAASIILECVGFTRVRTKATEYVGDDEECFMLGGTLVTEIGRCGPLDNTFAVRLGRNGDVYEQDFMLQDEAMNTLEGMIERSALRNTRWPVMLIKPKRWVLDTTNQ